ncbi:unnamed protein product, partial [Musa hybrid cultivar]
HCSSEEAVCDQKAGRTWWPNEVKDSFDSARVSLVWIQCLTVRFLIMPYQNAADSSTSFIV